MNGDEIRILREDKLGWGQRMFARSLGSCATTVSRWENNVNEPRQRYREAMSALNNRINQADSAEQEAKELRLDAVLLEQSRFTLADVIQLGLLDLFRDERRTGDEILGEIISENGLQPNL